MVLRRSKQHQYADRAWSYLLNVSYFLATGKTDTDEPQTDKGVLALIADMGDKQEGRWVQGKKLRKVLTEHKMADYEIYTLLRQFLYVKIIEQRRNDEDELEYRISIPLLQKRYVSQNMYQQYNLI